MSACLAPSVCITCSGLDVGRRTDRGKAWGCGRACGQRTGLARRFSKGPCRHSLKGCRNSCSGLGRGSHGLEKHMQLFESFICAELLLVCGSVSRQGFDYS